MLSGKVKFYNEEKGFGFIVPNNGGGDVFVHRSALNAAGLRGLDDDAAVSFELVEDLKNGKIKAENLSLI